MSLYPKQSLQMLVDLINQANPTLPVPVTTTNVLYGTPAVITPGSGQIQNTSIKVTAVASTKYIGNATLTYRRLDFATLLRGIPIVIYKYSPAATNASPYKISDLLPAINQKYGLNLTTADVVDGSLPAGNNVAVPAIGLPAGTRNSSITVNTQTTSPGYVGSFTLYWVQSPEDISTMLTVLNLESARIFPGNVSSVPSGGSTPIVIDLDVYSYDFTATLNQIATNLGVTLSALTTNYLTNSSTYFGYSGVTYGPAHDQLLAAIVAESGVQYNETQPASTPLSVYGGKLVHYALPNAAVPEANSKYFNNCLVMDLPAANSWGAGRWILHYNV